ncbi:RNA 3'-terminal phosphate cyclase [Caldivirga sp. UBA161]|uniref:RNA 3'-terminal phosphate cyclase n=1 Tax=Caldivirga sp. UBA161 TaxID=1915569 RepID=UPI0025C6D0ED|nr:RNA 3'-terminal phosphate cyclase [Caldivirga sp. UBA161]
MITIDGSMGEGGGQILRTALALSIITGKPFRIINIRAKRSNPGLQPQHLASVVAAARISNARVNGAYKGSLSLTFEPSNVKCGNYSIDIGTAGSVSLVLQTLLPVLAIANCSEVMLDITGGTDVPKAPPIDYVRFVLAHNLSLMGVGINLELIRRGHYPRGGGRVRVTVKPTSRLKPINITELGELRGIWGLSHAVRLPSHVAVRQAKAAEEYLSKLGLKPSINLEYYEQGKDPHLGPGSGITLWAESTNGQRIGADSLGERGKPAEEVGKEAAASLAAVINAGAAFDDHMGDMLIPFLALAEGNSEYTVANLTSHLSTNISIVKLFLNTKIEAAGYNKKVKITINPTTTLRNH